MKASSVTAPKKLSRDIPDLEEAIEEEDENDVLEPAEAEAADEEEELDLNKDKYIKMPKAKKPAGKKASKAAKAATDDEDDGEDDAPKKGKGKGKGSGRSKKA